MVFCKRRICPAGQITEIMMQLSCMKWKVKNFTDADIYVSVGTFEVCNTVRIAAGESEIIVDRDPRTGNRKTSRVFCIQAEQTGEVQILCV